MNLWTILGATLLGVATVLCALSVVKTLEKYRWYFFAPAFFLFLIGTDLTEVGIRAAIVGAAAFFLSLFSFWKKEHLRVGNEISLFLFRAGRLSCVAALIVLIIGEFRRPTSDEIEIEDRTGWIVPAKSTASPKDLLKLNWSTQDQNCHWPIASLMCDLCKIAYQDPADARERIKSEMGWDSETITGLSMQGYVINTGDEAIIILRGTESNEFDIIQDLKVIHSGTDDGGMHGGFVQGYDSMHSQVMKLLDRYKPKRVWITGHSLGGGMSIVCAYRLIKDGKYPIRGVMTFGQPKVVLPDMATFLEPRLRGKYVYFVNDMDMVTRMVSPYRHFGHMVRWNESEIERSKRPLASTLIDLKNVDKTKDVSEDISNEELTKMIDTAENGGEPRYTEDGHLIVEGTIPSVYDHMLASYDSMLETLRTHTGKAKP